MPNAKSIAVIAAVSLGVVLLHQKYAGGGAAPTVKLSHG